MLMLISPVALDSALVTYISIHLMLMLIIIHYMEQMSVTYFNTSHVNVNRKEFLNYSFKHNISIHLMLMLIEDFMHNIR